MTYDVLIAAGQSNAMQSDEAIPVPAAHEDRIDVWDDGRARPLGSTESSLLPSFGRAFAARHPDSRVLLVQVAAGSTGFLTTSLVPPPSGYKPGPGTWDRRLRADPHNLAQALVEQCLAVQRACPEARFRALLWSQGESDCTRIPPFLNEHSYARRLDDLLAFVRREIDEPRLPVIVGGMVPEWVAQAPERSEVERALARTPERVGWSAYVAGPAGAAKAGEPIHYSTAGQHLRGESMARVGLDASLAQERQEGTR